MSLIHEILYESENLARGLALTLTGILAKQLGATAFRSRPASGRGTLWRIELGGRMPL